MGNAIKYLKNQITHTSSSLNAEQVCVTLLLSIYSSILLVVACCNSLIFVILADGQY